MVADRLIRDHRADRVVVAGADSLLRRATLDALNKERRLMTPTNSNGFFPGEAGCAILIGAQAACATLRRTIAGFGMARESATIQGSDRCAPRAWPQAVRQARQRRRGAEGRGVSARRICPASTTNLGEAAFVAGCLNGGEREQPLDLWHPIEYLGEIGAAILPCLLAQAAHALQKRYAPGPLALCHVGSDDGWRAALIIDMRVYRHEQERLRQRT